MSLNHVWCIIRVRCSPPTEELSDPYIDNFIAAQQLPHKEWPGTGTALQHVLMAITRTRNHNVVVYRANMVSETEWDTTDPIDVSACSSLPATSKYTCRIALCFFRRTLLDEPHIRIVSQFSLAVCQMFWFDIAPVGSSSIENHRKSNQLDDFIPFGLFDAKGFGMTFDSSVPLPIMSLFSVRDIQNACCRRRVASSLVGAGLA